ncbi:MAG: hypothetical protein EHM64_08880 [Ignavibacteriae bacterium]|nr:MAG: hypothetical protein EHM64_08880 [Ignavibacteriota bacterium]
MKNQIRTAAVLAICLLAACSLSHQTNKQGGILSGTVYSLGNEPFTKLGLHTTSGTTYLLKCSKEIEQTLNSSQGKTVTLRYEKVERLSEGSTLFVTGIE